MSFTEDVPFKSVSEVVAEEDCIVDEPFEGSEESFDIIGGTESS